jgi:Holliday junction DNA helicase RuvB
MEYDLSLIRPNTLEEFIGQRDIKTNLVVYATAAKIQKNSLPHMMLSGGPGLGKTSCAFLSAQLMGGALKTVTGVSLQKVSDITSILANIKKNDFLFIDEIHRINKKIEEVLYSAMDDFTLDLIIGEGSQAKIVKIKLPNFTVLGATTKYGLLSQPFRNRFGIHFRFEEYNLEDLCTIISNFGKKNQLTITYEAAFEIAQRAKKTPRIALNLTKRIADFMYAKEEKELSKQLVLYAVNKMGLDEVGLENIDRSYLRILKINKPIGLQTVSAILQESTSTIEDTVEPYLMALKFIERTSKGRVITLEGLAHLNKYNSIK